ncbi:MAG TPA: hypothetical protein VGH28_05495 [Polyangiaceae bacterium]|jgi:hypothetical protein
MTTPHKTSRGQSEADTLADAKAMYAAAEADADVKAHLGPKYLAAMKSEIDQLESLAHGKAMLVHDKLADGAQLLDLSSHLLDVMKDVRDSAQGEVDDVTAKTLGRGADWNAKEPARLASQADAIAKFLGAHHPVVTQLHLDKQHLHDLAHLAQAIEALEGHHGKLVADVKSDTHARAVLHTSLEARSHHVRIKARLMHRHDAQKLAAFGSPVAHHRVVSRAPPTAPAPS